jgi:hypothetical protein
MMAYARVNIRRKFGVLVVRPRRLVEDAFAVAVADNVIGLAGNGLYIKSISSSHVRRWACGLVHGVLVAYQNWAGVVTSIRRSTQKGEELGNSKGAL